MRRLIMRTYAYKLFIKRSSLQSDLSLPCIIWNILCIVCGVLFGLDMWEFALAHLLSVFLPFIYAWWTVLICNYAISILHYQIYWLVYYFQAHGHGGYDSDFSDEESGEKSEQKTKR